MRPLARSDASAIARGFDLLGPESRYLRFGRVVVACTALDWVPRLGEPAHFAVGGCVETARPTTHQQPIYVVDGVVHYCVTNMPGAVGRTSTVALCNATLPYALELATRGVREAASADPALAAGINTIDGCVPNAAVADALGIEATTLDDVLARSAPRR